MITFHNSSSRAANWRSALLASFYRLAHAAERDNFDSARYSGIDPSTFFLTEHVAFLEYFMDHWQAFHTTRELLRDDTSRSLYDSLILFRLLGHNHVRLPICDPQRIEIPAAWFVSETKHRGMFGPLALYSVPIEGEMVWVQCWPRELREYLAGHYYFKRDNVSIRPESGDVVIDGGGCFGEMAAFFAHSVGSEGAVYVFDPMPAHCAIMRETFVMNGVLGERIHIVEAGLSDNEKKGSMPGGAIDPGARLGDDMPTRTIDGMDLPHLDFIKMDIEGSELAALRGGERSIRRWRPKLAISLYHRPEDFCTIPTWLDGLGIGYELHLDQYSGHQEETVLYAIAK